MCIEEIDHLGFKQRWFGIPMPKEDPSYEYCNNEIMVNFDNESVVKNATYVESTLKTKHASVLTITAVALSRLVLWRWRLSVLMITSQIVCRSDCRPVGGICLENGRIIDNCCMWRIQFQPSWFWIRGDQVNVTAIKLALTYEVQHLTSQDYAIGILTSCLNNCVERVV